MSSNQSNATGPTGTLYHVNLGYTAAKMPRLTISPSCHQVVRGRQIATAHLLHNSRGLSKEIVASSRIKSMGRRTSLALVAAGPLPASKRAGRTMYYQIRSFYDRAT